MKNRKISFFVFQQNKLPLVQEEVIQPFSLACFCLKEGIFLHHGKGKNAFFCETILLQRQNGSKIGILAFKANTSFTQFKIKNKHPKSIQNVIRRKR